MIFKGYTTFEFVFFGSMLLAILGTPVVIRLAKALGAVDAPGLRKVHARAVSRIGGVAIVFAAMVVTAVVLFIDNNVGQAFRRNAVQIVTLLAGGLSMFLIGLLDDLRGVRARHKFLVQVAAAAALCVAGGRVGDVSFGPAGMVATGEWGWLLTIVWIVGVTNAVNLIDGLDGLAAGVGLIAAGAVALFALYTGQTVLAALMLALLGSLAGFLFLNFNPARVFMGDCGSLFLGFMIAGASIMCGAHSHSLKGVGVAALALGVPIFDTLFSMLRRLLQRRSMFAPDQGHIHHRLLARGFGHHEAALLIYIISLVSASLGLLMLPTKGLTTLGVFVGVCGLLFVTFRLLGAVRLRETIRGVRRNHAIAAEARRQREGCETAELRLREAVTFDQWWAGLCAAAEDLEFLRLDIDLTNRDGSDRRLRWRAPVAAAADGDDLPALTVVVPIRDRRPTGPLRAEVDVHINGSVESAGRRVKLFGKLIDGYALAELAAAGRRPAERDEPDNRDES